MTQPDSLEKRAANRGERLIPGVNYNIPELVRHRNSYVFWQHIIEYDRAHGHAQAPIRIVDFGSGVGHGCATLAQIPGSVVVGVDNSPAAVEYARLHYAGPNISYVVSDLASFVATMDSFDYVVSRGVLEHIPDGLRIARDARWMKRLLFDVPYKDRPGNPFHVLHDLDEASFTDFAGAELFYQDADGFTYDAAHKPSDPGPNMIMCAAAAPDLPGVGALGFSFPRRFWYPEPDSPLWQWQAQQRVPLYKRLYKRLPVRVRLAVSRLRYG